MKTRSCHRSDRKFTAIKARLKSIRERTAHARERVRKCKASFIERRLRYLAWWQTAFGGARITRTFAYSPIRSLWCLAIALLERNVKSGVRKPVRNGSRLRRLKLEGLELRYLMATDLVSSIPVQAASVTSNGQSSRPSISDDGRYVTFVSDASNLAAGDTNNVNDIFVKDLVTGSTTLVSVDSSGNQANSASDWPSISGNGRYVTFVSDASNLVAGDTNYTSDVFVKDLDTGLITRVSVDSTGNQANSASDWPSISGNGRYVTFRSYASNLVAGDTNNASDIFVKDLVTGSTTHVSTDTSGNQANYDSYEPRISTDGRYVTFVSRASNLVAGDTNNTSDIFVKDLITGLMTRVSADSSGNQANGSSNQPSISDDGRYVTFVSDGSNLVAGDTNNTYDVFVKDSVTGSITRVSADGSGNQANSPSYQPSFSGDGRYVAFVSDASNLVAGDTNNTGDIFVKDLVTGLMTRVSADSSGNQANQTSIEPSISDDGRYVTFRSYANNLVAGDTYYSPDIYVKDLVTGLIHLASERAEALPDLGGNNASYGPSISGDGRYVTFFSYASNLVAGDTNDASDIFVKDLVTGSMTRVSADSSGNQANSGSEQPSISGDGRYVTFFSYASNLVAGDTNDASDIFVKDLITGSMTRVSADSNGNQANGGSEQPSFSGDGRYVTFRSAASNLVAGDTNNTWDIFVKDLVTSSITRVSADGSGNQANGSSYQPSISDDGRYVTFVSDGSNLVAGDTNNTYDVFVKDAVTGSMVRVSTDSSGNQANSGSASPSISGNGRYVTFFSYASNLVPGDNNYSTDIFVKDLVTGSMTRVSADGSGNQANGSSYQPGISDDGRYVTFQSDASNLVAGDTNNASDIFVKDLVAGSMTPVSADSSGNQANGESYEPSISDDGRYVTFQSYATELVEYVRAPFSNVYRVSLTQGDLEASLDHAGTLTITDVGTDGTNNDITISVAGSDLVITDAVDSFSSAPTGGWISPDGKMLTLPMGTVHQLVINGGLGDDQLRLDFAGGNLVPSLGLDFNAGAGSDTLSLYNGTTSGVSHAMWEGGSGSLQLSGILSGTIRYDDIEPVVDQLEAANRAYQFSDADDVVTLTHTQDGNLQLLADSASTVTFSNPTASLALDAGGGSDTVTVSNIRAGFAASLTINGGTGDDLVHFTGDLWLAADKALNVDLQNDAVNPGVDEIRVAAGILIRLNGTGAATLRSSRNIVLGTGSYIITEAGDVVLEANRSGVATSGDFVGILVDGATLGSLTGNISLAGRGGNGTLSGQAGVSIIAGASVGFGTTGLVTVDGVGGSAASNSNHGVSVSGNGSRIISGGGDVHVSGLGGGSGSSANNAGVYVISGGEVAAGGGGALTVSGTGGATTGGSNYGVSVSDLNSAIISLGGPVSVTGHGGGALGGTGGNFGVRVWDSAQLTSDGGGPVTVSGTGGLGSGGSNWGVYVAQASAKITSRNDSVSVTGTGGGSGTSFSNHGVFVSDSGQILAGGLGAVSVTGTGGINSSGSYNHGVSVASNSIITSSGGNVHITGTGGGSGASANNAGVYVESWGKLRSAGSGTLTVTGTGGASTGGSNYGVSVSDLNSAITSQGGAVSVTGHGGGVLGGIGGNFGVRVWDSAQLGAGGTGAVTVSGSGGLGNGGSNWGVYVAQASAKITSSGGSVSVTGTGGGSGTSFSNHGVFVSDSGQILAGGLGAVSVAGTGGYGSGGTNHGLSITGINSRITSGGGNVSVSGLGGNSAGSQMNYGVHVADAGEIMAGGSGTVTVVGSGATGIGLGSNNRGVYITGAGSQITSSGGSVAVTGNGGGSGDSGANHGVVTENAALITAAGSGTVTVVGHGGNTSGTGGDIQVGVYVFNSRITSGGGDVSVTGTGGGSGNSGWNYGVVAQSGGQITATNSGSVSVTGTGGNGGGGYNHGILLTGTNSRVTSSGGNIEVRGAAGANANSLGVSITSSGQVVASSGAPTVSIIADSMDLASPSSINAGGNTVSLHPLTAGTPVNLGAVTDTTINTLEISDAELDHITAGVIKVGSGSAGAISVSQPINPAASGTLHLVSGAGVSQSAQLSVANLAIEAGGNVAMSLGFALNDVDTLAARTTSGFITFGDADDLTVGSVSTLNGINAQGGSISLYSQGDVTISNTAAADDLAATGAAAVVYAVSVWVDSVNGKLTIADGANVYSTGGEQIYRANRMNLAGTVGAAGHTVELVPLQSNIAINLGSTTDAASGTLELSDAELDGITANRILIGNATTGDITLSGTISPLSTNTLELLAGGMILDGQATGTDLHVANLVLSATAGIGTGLDPLETIMTTLQASGGSGGVFVANTGSLTLVGSGVTADGEIVITVGSPLSVTANVVSRLGNVRLSAGESAGAGDDLTVAGGITISSQTGNVTLQAGDVVNLAAASRVSSPMGTIAAQIGFGDSDGISVGSIAGELISPEPVTVRGGNAADSITVYASASVADIEIKGGDGDDVIMIQTSTGLGVRVDGGGGSDSFIIQLGALAGPVKVSDNTGSNTVQIVGTPGDDVLTVTATQVSASSETITLDVAGSTSTALVIDGGGGTNEVTIESTPVGATVTGANVAASLSLITAPVSPASVNTPIVASASFIDLDTNDTHTATWDWGDGTTSTGTVTETSSSTGTTGSVRDTHNYTRAGVYTLKLTVTDNTGKSKEAIFQYVVIYDPNAGFVTGGGWIDSPAGAYLNTSIAGKATFGFNSKYDKGATAPTGNTAFQFKMADFNFKSTSYEWLVVSGAKARFRGVGTVNGAGSYGFELTAWDGQISGGGGSDRFRIKIWNQNQGNGIVYDNMPGASDGVDPVTALGGGSILIHKNPQALLASSENATGSGRETPTQELLRQVVDEAIGYWRSVGVDEGSLSNLQRIHVEPANLDGNILGIASETDTIWIDRDAAGHGWQLHPTDSSNPLDTKGMDLLSVVAHELGHKLGYHDSDDLHDLMGFEMEPGTRRLPIDSSRESLSSSVVDHMFAGLAPLVDSPSVHVASVWTEEFLVQRVEALHVRQPSVSMLENSATAGRLTSNRTTLPMMNHQLAETQVAGRGTQKPASANPNSEDKQLLDPLATKQSRLRG